MKRLNNQEWFSENIGTLDKGELVSVDFKLDLNQPVQSKESFIADFKKQMRKEKRLNYRTCPCSNCALRRRNEKWYRSFSLKIGKSAIPEVQKIDDEFMKGMRKLDKRDYPCLLKQRINTDEELDVLVADHNIGV